MKRLVLLALMLELAGCAARPAGPAVRLGLARDVGQGLNNAGEATIPVGGAIVFQGDDFIYGVKRPRRAKTAVQAVSVRSPAAVPDQVFKQLGRRVTVQIHASPKDTITSGTERWKGQPVGDLLVLSYAYGDAAAGTSQADYRAALQAAVSSARAAGTPVFLIVPPNSSDDVLNRKLDVYRQVMRELAARGTGVFEAQQSLDAQRIRPAPSAALDDLAYTAIAGVVLQHIKLGPPRQAGS